MAGHMFQEYENSFGETWDVDPFLVSPTELSLDPADLDLQVPVFHDYLSGEYV